MGESAIKSHAKGKLDLSRAPNESIASFFSKSNESDSSDKPSSNSDKSSSSSLISCGKDQTIDSMIVSTDSIKAEIMWVLKVFLSNFSVISCRNISKLFAEMLNCPISDAFKPGPTKCRYLICYGLGLAPHFSQLLVKEKNSSLFIATSFDECFNQINQKGQMDLLDTGLIHPIKCQLDIYHHLL